MQKNLPVSATRREQATKRKKQRPSCRIMGAQPMPAGGRYSDSLGKWWAVTGSNCRPSRCKRDALPTELTARRDMSREHPRGPALDSAHLRHWQALNGCGRPAHLPCRARALYAGIARTGGNCGSLIPPPPPVSGCGEASGNGQAHGSLPRTSAEIWDARNAGAGIRKGGCREMRHPPCQENVNLPKISCSRHPSGPCRP